MIDERNNSVAEEVSCHVCQQEVPQASALSVEGREYLFFFCGQGCFVEWSQDEAPVTERPPKRR